jgi:hypothetical protein
MVAWLKFPTTPPSIETSLSADEARAAEAKTVNRERVENCTEEKAKSV